VEWRNSGRIGWNWGRDARIEERFLASRTPLAMTGFFRRAGRLGSLLAVGKAHP